jgi:hypothetical protein
VPLPLHVVQEIHPITGRTFSTAASAALKIYDFGALSLEYRIPFEGTLPEWVELSSDLYSSEQFAADARARSALLLDAIRPAVHRPASNDEVEDYLIFSLSVPVAHQSSLEQFVTRQGHLLAQVLSSNTSPLSLQQQHEELSGQIAYFADDLTIITWNAAIVVGANMDDVVTVLELANVQLRELHYLDDQLDRNLQESYETSARAARVKVTMRRIRELMLDGQAFSEAVTNAFKPFPDAFLARVYTLASRRLGLSQFNQSIKEKLHLLDTVYTTLSDEAAHARSARLEWIVIILIFIEIVMGLSEWVFPMLTHG